MRDGVAVAPLPAVGVAGTTPVDERAGGTPRTDPGGAGPDGGRESQDGAGADGTGGGAGLHSPEPRPIHPLVRRGPIRYGLQVSRRDSAWAVQVKLGHGEGQGAGRYKGILL